MSEHEPPATIGVPRATTKSRHTGFGASAARCTHNYHL
jgi:hypothetical protein